MVLPSTVDDIHGKRHAWYEVFIRIHGKYSDKYGASSKSERPKNPSSQSQTSSDTDSKYHIKQECVIITMGEKLLFMFLLEKRT